MNRNQKKKIIDIQLGRNYIYSELNEIRNSWNYKSIEYAIQKIVSSNTKDCKKYRNGLLPTSYEELGESLLFTYKPNELECELNWYIAHINNFKEQINLFLLYRNQYENFLILGKYEQALEMLNKINKEICVSIWGLDNLFILAESESGLEKNKEILANVNSKGCNSWVSIFADLFSFKAEKGVNNRQYLHRIERLFSNVTDDIKSFFEEKLYPIYNISMNNIYDLLYYNKRLSIIDMYNVLIKIFVRSISDSCLKEESFQIIRVAIKKIAGINDNALLKLLLYIDTSIELPIDNFDKKMFIIGNTYTEGKYEEVICECQDLIKDHANCFEIYEYYVKSHIMMSKSLSPIWSNSIAQDLALSMYTAYIKDSFTLQSYSTLCRIERIFTGSNFSAGIANFIVDKYMIGNSRVQSFAKEFLSSFINLKYINLFEENRNGILSILEKGLGNGSSLELYKLINNKENTCEDIKIDRDRYRWYKIKSIDYKGQKIQELEKWYDEICLQKGVYERYQKERISTELFYLYIEEHKILKAENLFVKNKIENKFSILRMDLEEIYTAIKNSDKFIKMSICTPIICYLYNKNNYADIYSHTANFMELNNLERPSDIFERFQEYDKEELIFFLKNICTNEILDSMYLVFDNEDQVESERIKICQFLQQFDKENEGIYIDEISCILKNKKIMHGVKYIEDVKIDLNLDKIIEQHRNVFYDSFKRFKQIGELDIEYNIIDLTNNTVYIKRNTDSKKYNHKIIVFKEMLLDFEHEFAFGKYGLDQSLGTRIRHGSIQNQLRVVFERNNIIFVKKSTNDLSYIPSMNFSEICKSIDYENRNKLYNAISRFSQMVDTYIEELKSKYIQIRTEELHTEGLIDLRIDISELMKLFNEAQTINNENIVLESFELYWLEKTRIGLEYTRSYFEDIVKKEFIHILSHLEEDLHIIPGIDKLHFNFYDAISRSRTEIQNAVNTVSNWFKLPTKQTYKEFSAGTLIETCETINNRVFSNYDLLKINKTVNSNSIIEGKYFSYFVDILIIIFTNAYYHSGFIDNISSLEIDCEITEKEDTLFIFIRNNLSPNIIISELEKKVDEIQAKIENSINLGQYSNFEGGSGFIKIWKILEWNIAAKGYLEFGVDTDGKHFFTRIGVDLKCIIVKESEKL